MKYEYTIYIEENSGSITSITFHLLAMSQKIPSWEYFRPVGSFYSGYWGTHSEGRCFSDMLCPTAMTSLAIRPAYKCRQKVAWVQYIYEGDESLDFPLYKLSLVQCGHFQRPEPSMRRPETWERNLEFFTFRKHFQLQKTSTSENISHIPRLPMARQDHTGWHIVTTLTQKGLGKDLTFLLLLFMINRFKLDHNFNYKLTFYGAFYVCERHGMIQNNTFMVRQTLLLKSKWYNRHTAHYNFCFFSWKFSDLTYV
jgi:hypothetical protein